MADEIPFGNELDSMPYNAAFLRMGLNAGLTPDEVAEFNKALVAETLNIVLEEASRITLVINDLTITVEKHNESSTKH